MFRLRALQIAFIAFMVIISSGSLAVGSYLDSGAASIGTQYQLRDGGLKSVNDATPGVETTASTILPVYANAPLSTDPSTLYNVTFTETGLGDGTNWSVSLNSSILSSTTNSIVFQVPNGSYQYTVSPLSGYTTSEYSGSVDVLGSDVPVTVSWVQVTYSVTFSETGLPSGTSWSVDLDSNSQPSTTDSIVFQVPNGTHQYTVSQVSGYTASQYSGSVDVSGSDASVSITWTPVSYSITFSETGLSGETWYVSLNNSQEQSSGTSIVFTVPNGNYDYTITSPTGYSSDPSSGSVTVSGSDQSVSVSFSSLSYSVTFQESNLPAGTTWWVNLSDGSTYSSTSNSLSFTEQVGDYTYTVATSDKSWSPSPQSGSFSVIDSAVSVGVTFNQVLYSLTFKETGLSSGTTWYVTLDGVNSSSSTSSITFSVQNGTHDFTVFASGYTCSEPSGSIVINGASQDHSLSFTSESYTVSFQETGLSANTNWQVTFNGQTLSSSSEYINFAAVSGTYDYQVGSVPNYVSDPSSGTINVVSDSTTTITFTPLYSVTFNENGLPSGTTWSVTLDNTPEQSTGTSIVFTVPNGNYQYTISQVSGYQTSAYSGSVSVSGSDVSVAIQWNPTTYNVTFSETGLPSGKTWYVSLNNSQKQSADTSIVFTVPNGNYQYNILQVSGYTASEYSGSVDVAGSDVNVPITWTQVTYSVTFSETGLPSGTSWSVDLDSNSQPSTGDTIVFQVPNGTHQYTISQVSGYTASKYSGSVDVSGSDASVPITWTPVSYNVTFSETGLSGETWYVTFNGSQKQSASTSIIFTTTNGKYDYTITPPTGYSSDPSGGSVTVSGSDQSVSVSFSSLSYSVTFQESNLPSGTTWWVNLSDGSTYSSTSNSLSFPKSVGDYTYTLETSNKLWEPNSSSGTISVKDSDVSVNVVFNPVSYTLKFTETGLQSSTTWSVTLDGVNSSSSTSSITFSVQNGTHYFTVFASGYTCSEPSGSIVINGASATHSLSFAPVTYLVSFKENGLSANTNWQVTFNGQTLSSSTKYINFTAVSGTYNYQIGNIANYVSNPSSGTINVASDSTTIITFTSLYTVSFDENGLPSGTTWYVTLDNTPEQSTNSSISFTVPNGNYQYSVSPVAGYTTSKYTGSVSVSGSDVSLTIQWNPVTYNVTFSETGLPSGTTWSVTLDNTQKQSKGSSIVFTVLNGSYQYTISQVSGYMTSKYAGSVSVSGSDVPLTIQWSQVSYNVTFTETGLTSGTTWSVTLDGISKTSSTSSITFTEPEGTYSYTINGVSGYVNTPETGSIDLTSDSSVSVSFSKLYVVSFYEDGLTSNTDWTVTLGSETQTSSSAWINFTRIEGTYSYQISSVSGYTVSPSSGQVDVGTGDVTEPVTFAPIKYSVVFTENGLPSGTKWSVKFNGKTSSSTQDTITFSATMGTYSFSVTPINDYSISPTSGLIYVYGSDQTQQIDFKLVKYSVTFFESGLPSGITWNVTLNGIKIGDTSAEIAFQMPNGTYSYSVDSIAEYELLNGTGKINVDGSDVTINVQFRSMDKYLLVFTESGLPDKTPWSVTVNGAVYSSNSAGITAVLTNGTYTYYVNMVPGYMPKVSSGEVTINGGDSYVVVEFNQVLYNLVFTESGLEQGTNWEVIVNGIEHGSTSDSIALSLPNGTYQFTVTHIFGYGSNPVSGNVTINGADKTVSVKFSATPYTVTFTEIGLPIGKYWFISINGQNYSSSSNTTTVTLIDGTYDFYVGIVPGYRADPSQGTIAVNGSDLKITISFTIVNYQVTFHEDGLPPGTVWEISLGNKSVSSTSESITFEVKNGTYTYNISKIPGYYPILYSGEVIVNGQSPPIIEISWNMSSYTVKFVESGLLNETYWSVALENSVMQTSLNESITFYLPNGTYNYSISKIQGYTSQSYNGSFVVNGSNVTQLIKYLQVKYVVRFLQIGLQSGIIWSISLNDTTKTSITDEVLFNLPNGTYFFNVSNESGYGEMLFPIQVFVNGSNQIVNVHYLKLFLITFVEQGLPSDTRWSVTLDGVTKTSTNNVISFYETNGTYSYTIIAYIQQTGYTSPTATITGFISQNGQTFSPSNTVVLYGQVRVAGSTLEKSVQFVNTDANPNPSSFPYSVIEVIAVIGVIGLLIYLIRSGRIRR